MNQKVMRSGRESRVGGAAFAASFCFWFTSREFCGARPAATIVIPPAAWSGLFQSRELYHGSDRAVARAFFAVGVVWRGGSEGP